MPVLNKLLEKTNRLKMPIRISEHWNGKPNGQVVWFHLCLSFALCDLFMFMKMHRGTTMKKMEERGSVVKVITLFVIYRGDQFYLKRISSLFICRFRKWNLRRFKCDGFLFLCFSPRSNSSRNANHKMLCALNGDFSRFKCDERR